MTRRIFVAIFVVMLATSAAGTGRAGTARSTLEMRGAGYVESLEMLFNVRSGGVLSLGTTTGSVNVQTWSKDQIRVVVTKRVQAGDAEDARRILDLFSVRALHGGKDLKLKARATTRECADAVGVEFTIWVPKSYNLDITTSNGSISLPDVDGAFSARTGEGSISVDCATDDLDVEVEDRTDRPRPDSPGVPGQDGPGAQHVVE
jgi:hypothetical protein